MTPYIFSIQCESIYRFACRMNKKYIECDGTKKKRENYAIKIKNYIKI